MTPWEALHDRQRHERRDLLMDILRQCQGSRTVAAERLGLQRTYLCRLVREYEIADRVPRVGGSGDGRVRARQMRERFRLLPEASA